MSLHKEASFENGICEHLIAKDWLHAAGDAQDDPDQGNRNARYLPWWA